MIKEAIFLGIIALQLVTAENVSPELILECFLFPFKLLAFQTTPAYIPYKSNTYKGVYSRTLSEQETKNQIKSMCGTIYKFMK